MHIVVRLAERIAERQLKTAIIFSEPVYKSGLKQLTRMFELPRSTLNVVQGINSTHVANSRRDKRRGSYSNSNSNSDRIISRNSSFEFNSMIGNSTRLLNGVEDNGLRAIIGNAHGHAHGHGHSDDIRRWLFIDQNGGDIMV